MQDMPRAYGTHTVVGGYNQRIEIRCYKMLRAYGPGAGLPKLVTWNKRHSLGQYCNSGLQSVGEEVETKARAVGPAHIE